jgi:hypothetical protein
VLRRRSGAVDATEAEGRGEGSILRLNWALRVCISSLRFGPADIFPPLRNATRRAGILRECISFSWVSFEGGGTRWRSG